MSEKTKQVFIGARALQDEVHMILPTYNLLLDQITQIRDAATATSKNDLGNRNRKEYNNTIGVFGQRGSGKTSILYTIMESLEGNNNNDMFLPIIEPDNFGDNTKIAGSIVGLLSKLVDDELDYIKNNASTLIRDDLYTNFFSSCKYKENNVLNKCCRKLKEYYMYTESEFRTVLSKNFYDKATHIDNSSYLLIPDIEFKKRLLELIDQLVKVRKERSGGTEPLIFIFVDDIDLKTKKCKELLDSILQYTVHPNLVTILSGDYEILKESLTLSLIADENLAISNMKIEDKIGDEDTILARKRYLSNEYLKKIIPSSRRHNAVSWNTRNLPLFAFDGVTLNNRWDNFMDVKNVFGYSNGGYITPISYSYDIFDKTPRGIINVYYHLDQIAKAQIRDKDRDRDRDGEQNFERLKSLIDTIVLSSRELVDMQRVFFENCLIWGNSPETTSIKYDFFWTLISNDKNINPNDKKNYTLAFKFLIVCEILKEMQDKVVHDDEEYIKVKNDILDQLFKSPDLNKINEYEGEGGYLVNKLQPMVKILDIKNSLILLQHIIGENHIFEYDYNSGGNHRLYFRHDEKQKNQNVFKSVYELVTQKGNEKLLENMYIQMYDDKNSKLGRTIWFLDHMSSITKEYDKTRKIFSNVVEEVSKDLSEKVDSHNKYKDHIGAQLDGYLLETMFINTLTEIRSSSYKELSGSSEGEEKKKYEKQYKHLSSINSKGADSIDAEEVEKINRNIQRIEKALITKIKELGADIENIEITFINEDKVQEAHKKFQIGVSGSSDTKYKGVQQFVGKELGGSTWYRSPYKVEKKIFKFTEFYSVFRLVRGLSENNRVWYGRREAVEFLSVLQQDFLLDTALFKDIAPVLHELAIYKEKLEEYVNDEDFEEIKKDMKELMDSAFKKAMNITRSELEIIGSSLEEQEEQEEQEE